jgi:1-acyl-sn-glycerol-3-phosphate acyltransferase
LEPIIKGNTYDTPIDKPRLLMDRLALNTRLFFMAGVINIVNRARLLADKGQYNDKDWLKSCHDIMKLIEGCGGRFHLRGLDNIHKSPEPVVFISNHMSTLETFVFPCFIVPFREVTYVVKESLVKHPFFGSIMRSRDPIVVTRNNPKADFKIVMEKGQELLAQGKSIIIFPQSTRTTTFSPENFNTLGIKLARANKVKVVPVAIKTDFWGNGKYLKDFGKVSRDKHIYMTFGEPFLIKGSGNEEHKYVIDFIQTHINEWNEK